METWLWGVAHPVNTILKHPGVAFKPVIGLDVVLGGIPMHTLWAPVVVRSRLKKFTPILLTVRYLNGRESLSNMGNVLVRFQCAQQT